MHHAFVVEGDVDVSLASVLDFTDKSFGMPKGHADVVYIDRIQGNFGVDDVEDVVQINSRKPISGNRKIVILAISTISHQAQNALLKVLEEPRPGTIFFILTRTAGIFLPTILSRVQILRDTSSAQDHGATDGTNKSVTTKNLSKEQIKEQKNISKTLSATAFVEHDISSRLRQVKEILKMKDDEEVGDEQIFDFITNIEKEACVRTESIGMKDLKPRLLVAEVFAVVSDFVRDSSSSKKMLLEYLALRLPSL